jgi:hypothetical protein
LDGEAEITFHSANDSVIVDFSSIDILTPSVIHLGSVRVTIIGQAVPEPGSVVLVTSVLLVAGCWARRRRKRFAALSANLSRPFI